MKKLLKSKQKGITLIALIITIIVLLILAGVALSAITGNESAINKATQARTENDQGAARDAALLMATGYIQEYMTNKYSQGSSDLESAAETTGHYVARKMNTKTSGEFTFTTNGSALTVSKGGNTIVTGTIEDKGTITWDANINGNESGNGGNNGGSGNEQGNNNNQGGNETTTPNPGLSTEERALLASNNMAELTTSQIDADTNLTNDQKTALKDGNKVKAVLTGNVPVPVGYDYMEGTSTIANAAGENGWGVVIKDSNQNEWVWVPVPDATILYDEISPTQIGAIKKESELEYAGLRNSIKVSSRNNPEIRLIVADDDSSSSEDNEPTETEEERAAREAKEADEAGARATTVEKKSKSAIGYYKGNPSDRSGYREPALVLSFDLKEEYYTQAGFSSATQMAQAFVKDYNDMIESITKYGGFYVGRYELTGTKNGSEVTSAGTKNGGTPLNRTNWYQSYKVCRELGEEGKTQSTMIWGTQWDMVCKWTNDSGDQVSSSEFHSSAHTGSIANAGANEADKRNNIYDLEGNCTEWTQEAEDSNKRAYHGGTFDNWSGNRAEFYSGQTPDKEYNHSHLASRPTLYMK